MERGWCVFGVWVQLAGVGTTVKVSNCERQGWRCQWADLGASHSLKPGFLARHCLTLQ